MNGDVDPSSQQRLLDLLHEHAPFADLAERTLAVAVARRGDRDEGDLDTGRAQCVRRLTRLRQRQPRAARSDANEHRTSSLLACSART